MIDGGLLPENFRGVVNGFNYGVINTGSDFVVAAIPNASGSGRTVSTLRPTVSSGIPPSNHWPPSARTARRSTN
jgi:hypothetical protein